MVPFPDVMTFVPFANIMSMSRMLFNFSTTYKSETMCCKAPLSNIISLKQSYSFGWQTITVVTLYMRNPVFKENAPFPSELLLLFFEALGFETETQFFHTPVIGHSDLLVLYSADIYASRDSFGTFETPSPVFITTHIFPIASGRWYSQHSCFYRVLK